MPSKFTANYLPELFALGFFRSKPSIVTVNLTQRCNQRCIYCEIGQSLPSIEKDTLTVDDLTWIIDQMADNKIGKISLCGGEPFLFSGLINLVAYAGTRNIKCSITTNGMTAFQLSESELNILKECKTEINLSIDSFQDDIQSFTRGSGNALSNALKSLERLNKNGIPVTILTVISRYNFSDLSKFFIEAYEKGIKQVLFQPVIYYSNYPGQPAIENKSLLNVSVDKLDILMEELRKILLFEKTHRINTNVYRIFPWIGTYLRTAAGRDGKWFFKELLGSFFCRELYAIIDINFNGGIQPCGLTPASVSIINNRQPGLMALWLKATEEIKKDLSDERFYTYCNGCCHHFSRNMLASIVRHPVENHKALGNLTPLILSRMKNRILKNLTLYT
ncbi:MAG: radical SAM protein [Bacteroidota bacterium]